MRPYKAAVNTDIAKLTGWTGILNGTGYRDHSSAEAKWYEVIPDFCNDLNATQKVIVDQVPDDKWDEFIDIMEQGYMPPGLRPQARRKWAMTASAEVLARTFLEWKKIT